MNSWSKQKILKRITLQWQQVGEAGGMKEETISYKSPLSFGWFHSVFILNTRASKDGVIRIAI